IDLLYDGKVDGFGIMSSDSDFTPLVTRLRQDGLIVYGFGSAKAPEAFKTACTRFIEVDSLIKTAAAEDGKSTGTPVDVELVDLLGAAWKAANRDDDGFAKLQEVGQIAGNRSSFDVRNYGFKRLSDLFRGIDNFELKRLKDNQLYVRRLR
ncbi:MAG TPA: NYN domain-containing protein, partial [Sphingomonadaceae bacterium]|nr:NYN domain-containing protein [Sphingomonadaceae bacterium]